MSSEPDLLALLAGHAPRKHTDPPAVFGRPTLSDRYLLERRYWKPTPPQPPEWSVPELEADEFFRSAIEWIAANHDRVSTAIGNVACIFDITGPLGEVKAQPGRRVRVLGFRFGFFEVKRWDILEWKRLSPRTRHALMSRHRRESGQWYALLEPARTLFIWTSPQTHLFPDALGKVAARPPRPAPPGRAVFDASLSNFDCYTHNLTGIGYRLSARLAWERGED